VLASKESPPCSAPALTGERSSDTCATTLADYRGAIPILSTCSALPISPKVNAYGGWG